jgi:hypothetical protein
LYLKHKIDDSLLEGKSIIIALVVSVALSGSIIFMLYKNDTTNAVVQKLNGTMQIVVVPYFDPTSPLWQVIYDEADKYPGTIKYVIINPCSGPCGSALPQDWENIILTLKSKKIKTLGYIFNNSESFSNIDYYMKNPQIPTDGIFFDNEGSIDDLAVFKTYADYVHHLGGIVYINPGYNYTYVDNYLKSGAADVANIHEIDSSNSHQIIANKEFSPWKISVIVGNVTSPQEMQYDLSDMADKGIGVSYMYVSSYGTLPEYFPDEVQQAAITQIQVK